MAKKGNLINLAKKGGVTKEKQETSTDDPKEKAKQKVSELLDEVNLSKKQDELLEIDKETAKSTDWLEEQVALLTEENQNLRMQLAEAKANPQVVSAQNPVYEQNITMLFNELQSNLLGENQERTVWKDVSIPYLLNKLISMFPSLNSIRRF